MIKIGVRSCPALACLAAVLLLSACASPPTLMPTAVPPEIAATATVGFIAPTATARPVLTLPPTWTPPPTRPRPTPMPPRPTPTLTAPPLSFADLSALLLQVGEFRPGVPGTIGRSLPDSTIAEDMVNLADAAVFQEFEDLEGMVGVAFYRSESGSQRLYQGISDWMWTTLDDYDQAIDVNAHALDVGEVGFAVELYLPPLSRQVYQRFTWNMPGGDSWGWMTVTDPAQYVSYLVFTRCNTVTYIQIRASLRELLSYAYRLDTKLFPLACQRDLPG